MKQALLLIALLLCFFSYAQQTITNSIMHDGMQRDYIIYIPASYTGDEEVPLVLNFHGLGSNATQQMFYGDFRSIADTAGFIVVHPEGSVFMNTTHWNVGGFTDGSPTDDVGFTSALLDTLSAEYAINVDRIYSTGMSNGGYMSFLLACQLSDRIAAIASVTGSMTPETYDECDAQHPTPIMQIHGTADPTVPYNGTVWSKSIDDVLAYWKDYNNCPEVDRVIEVEDTNLADGSTVDRIFSDPGDRDVRVEHFQIENGAHTWPGSIFNSPGTNYDIDASAIIWDFFGEFDINGKIGTTVSNEEIALTSLTAFPNPVQNTLVFNNNQSDQVRYSIITLSGEIIRSGTALPGSSQIDLSELSTGMYLLQSDHKIQKLIKR